MPVILPLHPRTKKMAKQAGLDLTQLKIIDPIGYFDIHQLLGGARGLLTDSGGLQKESYFHKTPCITLREETEWTETITHGWNRLWIDEEKPCQKSEINEYGHGKTAEFIIDKIEDFLNI
jgi:UDP-GlcNAc3NAcA epimerase